VDEDRDRSRTCLEAEEAVLVRATMRIAVRVCRKAHLGQKVLSGTGLKRVREDKLNLPNNLETFDPPVFVAQDIDTFL